MGLLVAWVNELRPRLDRLRARVENSHRDNRPVAT